MTNALARFASLPALIAAYQNAEATIRRTFSELVDAERNLNEVFQIGKEQHAHMRIDASRGRYHSSFEDPSEAIDLLKRQAWRAIVDRLELRRMLSVERWKDLDAMLDKGTLPPITEESVADFAQGYLDRLPEMLTESIQEAFEFLRPRSERLASLKTNSQMEVPPKVIITAITRGFTGGFEVSHYWEQKLIAVERVFQALDGQGSISKSYWSELHQAVKASGKSGRGETTWFVFRACKNGNLHLEFRRLDLLKRLNEIAGGKRFRPERADGVRSGAEITR